MAIWKIYRARVFNVKEGDACSIYEAFCEDGRERCMRVTDDTEGVNRAAQVMAGYIMEEDDAPLFCAGRGAPNSEQYYEDANDFISRMYKRKYWRPSHTEPNEAA